jgi:hypothetical protein
VKIDDRIRATKPKLSFPSFRFNVPMGKIIWLYSQRKKNMIVPKWSINLVFDYT